MSARRYDDKLYLPDGRVFVSVQVGGTRRRPSLGDRFAVWSCTDAVTMALGAVAFAFRLAWSTLAVLGRVLRGVVVLACRESREDTPQGGVFAGLLVIGVFCLVYAALSAVGALFGWTP